MSVTMSLVALPGHKVGVELQDSETIINGIAKPVAVPELRELLGGRGVATMQLDEDEAEGVLDSLDYVIERDV